MACKLMPAISSSRFAQIALASSLLLLIAVPTGALAAGSTQVANPGGLIVPLYFWPTSQWNDLIQMKQAHPSMPVIAVVNPGNGPGTHVEPTYVTWIDKLRAVGITVVGYIPTDWGSRSISSIEANMVTFKSFYEVNGIFLDQMTNQPGRESYYSALTAYARSQGLQTVVGNPGTQVSPAFIGTVSVLLVFENSYVPTLSRLQSMTMGQTRDDFAMISYDTPVQSAATVGMITHYVRYVYLTAGTMPAPYYGLSTYFDTLVSQLNAPS
ncbi:MAG: spherulation-specific family 4 protein [Nitrososphaerales archaeon]|jgi:hypothetical protein